MKRLWLVICACSSMAVAAVLFVVKPGTISQLGVTAYQPEPIHVLSIWPQERGGWRVPGAGESAIDGTAAVRGDGGSRPQPHSGPIPEFANACAFLTRYGVLSAGHGFKQGDRATVLIGKAQYDCTALKVQDDKLADLALIRMNQALPSTVVRFELTSYDAEIDNQLTWYTLDNRWRETSRMVTVFLPGQPGLIGQSGGSSGPYGALDGCGYLDLGVSGSPVVDRDRRVCGMITGASRIEGKERGVFCPRSMIQTFLGGQ